MTQLHHRYGDTIATFLSLPDRSTIKDEALWPVVRREFAAAICSTATALDRDDLNHAEFWADRSLRAWERLCEAGEPSPALRCHLNAVVDDYCKRAAEAEEEGK
ncbi:MAG: hypothetical protein ACON4Z_08410 [Planctomycetota bacterium]